MKHKYSFIYAVLTAAAASSLSLIGGVALEGVSDKIIPIIPLIIALPGLNNLVGDYGSIIAAHMGDPLERQRTPKMLLKIILKILPINIIAISSLSLLLALKRGYLFDQQFAINFLLFIAISIFVVVMVLFVINLVLDRLLSKRGYNPDDFLIPISTAMGDILMLIIVALGATLIF